MHIVFINKKTWIQPIREENDCVEIWQGPKLSKEECMHIPKAHAHF